MKRSLSKTSRFLSLILRHKPERVGLELDDGGWIEVSALLDALDAHGSPVSQQQLERVVEQNDKQRFTIRDGKIRANQGHSVSVELNLVPRAPPDQLFHGTASRSMAAILEHGLKPMRRQHVHLSWEIAVARNVGSRHGRPEVLVVDAARMAADGFRFFLSDNKVWLTDSVPSRYLRVYQDS